MKENIERGKPRFDKRIQLPAVPEGMELHKFHGKPVLLTARSVDEPLFGNSSYTERQIRELTILEEIRRQNQELLNGLNPEGEYIDALRTAIENRPIPAIMQPLGIREGTGIAKQVYGVILLEN